MPLPFLLDAKTPSVQPPPPLRLRQVDGLRDVWRADGSGITASRRELPSFAQKAGLRYERKVLDTLSRLFGEDLELRPWFGFRDANGNGIAQPDAVLRVAAKGGPRQKTFEDQTVIFEVKLHHTATSWWQLRGLYQPLLEFRSQNVKVCEICSSYDPAVSFPEPVELFFDVEKFHTWAALGDSFGVWQMKV